MNTHYLVVSKSPGGVVREIEATSPEQAVHAYCGHERQFRNDRVVVIHGDSATVYAVNEIKSLSVVRLGGY